MFDQNSKPTEGANPVNGMSETVKKVSPPPNLPGIDETLKPPTPSSFNEPAPIVPTPSNSGVLKTPQVEDMFSETESPSTSQITRPLQPGQATQMPVSEQEVFGGRSILDNKVLLALLVIIGVAVIGGLIWFMFDLFVLNKTSELNNNENSNLNINSNVNDNTNINVNTNSNVNVNANENINNNTNVTPIQDSDNDGLSDEEEKELGTNPQSYDSDGDGLIDRVEVKIYKSDPLNKDTDGDGYNDGDEVINGFDPVRGSGARLFDVP